MTTPDTIDYDQLKSFARLVRRRPDRSYRYAVMRTTRLGRGEVLTWHRSPTAIREGLNRAIQNRGSELSPADFCAYEVTEAA